MYYAVVKSVILFKFYWISEVKYFILVIIRFFVVNILYSICFEILSATWCFPP